MYTNINDTYLNYLIPVELVPYNLLFYVANIFIILRNTKNKSLIIMYSS